MTDPPSPPRLSPLSPALPIFLLPDYIPPTRAATLLSHVAAVPKPKWRTLAHRRLQQWGGMPTQRGMLREAMPGWIEELCAELEQMGVIRDEEEDCDGAEDGRVGQVGGHSAVAVKDAEKGTVRRPNHCLINEYLPGQGILQHLDGPLYLPCVATLSLGSHCLLDFYPVRENETVSSSSEKSPSPSSSPPSTSSPAPAFSLFVPPNSLYIQTAPLYYTHMHAVAERDVDVVTVPAQATAARGGSSDGHAESNGAAARAEWGRGASEEADDTEQGPEPQRPHVVDGSTILNLADLLAYHRDREQKQEEVEKLEQEQEQEGERVVRLERRTRVSFTFRVVRKVSKGVWG